MFWTYVLRSRSSGRYYTGSTSDLEVRLQQHNNDESTSTKNRGPWELVYHEEFGTLPEAVRRERYFKTGQGREELKKVLESRESRGSVG
jgi:putative endonuclease